MYWSLYRAVARVAHRLPLGRGPGKLAASLAGRRVAGDRWVDWARATTGTDPLVWVHAASVGEAIAVEPVVLRLRRALPAARHVLTFSSSSMADWPAPAWAERADYVPLDEPGPVSRTLSALQPSLLLYARGDLWPELTRAALELGVPTAVVGATVRPRSLRLRWPARSLTRSLAGRLGYVGAVTDQDARRWIAMGATPAVVESIGDPRHDAVADRAAPLDPPGLQSVREWAREGPVLVAGSIEPPDEIPLLDALAAIHPRWPAARLLLVPHEPDPPTVERIARLITARGLASNVWRPGAETPAGHCVVVAARGLLADLYALGIMAYVGGGFRRGRLHAVIEPAARGLPVLMGPEWRGTSDAEALLAAGGGAAVASAGELAAMWLRWLDQPGTRAEAGRAAGSVVRVGAAQAAANAVRRLLRR